LRTRYIARYCSREEAALSEYVQFVGAMILFIAILTGSYWFVLYSPGSPSRGDREREAG
jgi:hypothetical protein